MSAILTLIAIAAALSPIALIELVLVLFSDRRTLNSPFFVVALIAFTAVGAALGAIGSRTSGSSADRAALAFANGTRTSTTTTSPATARRSPTASGRPVTCHDGGPGGAGHR